MVNLRRYISGLLILFWISGCGGQNETARLIREESPFNDNWIFLTDSAERSMNHNRDSSFETISKTGTKVVLPHTWNVMPGLENYYGPGWYFKEFYIPDSWDGSLIRIHFNAINRDAILWLNGKKIMERVGVGYTPFDVDISNALNYGENNHLVICVSNEFSKDAVPYLTKFDWAADGGIIRKVFLIKTDKPSIDFTQVSPYLKPGKKGHLIIKIGLLGVDDINTIDVWMKISEYNQPSSRILFDSNRKVSINHEVAVLDLDLENINVWHFHRPYLYQLTIAIGHNMVLTDHVTIEFGFRSFAAHGSGILFNGEPVRLPGLEWMPGSNPESGMAESHESMGKMLELLKKTNAVLTRFHWEQDDFILKWCDENGLLVQEEIPLWQAPFPGQINDTIRQIVYRHAREMVRAHYNHPSIIAWGVGNEMQARDEKVKSLISDTRELILELDSTRMINYVSNTLQIPEPEKDGTNEGELLMWNDYSGLWYNMSGNDITEEMLPGLLDRIHDRIKYKPVIISEYGLCEPVFSGGDPRRIQHMRYHTSVYAEKPYVAGVIYFSLNDYRTHMGEEGAGRFRRRVHGLVDLEGNTKPSYEALQSCFSPLEDLKVAYINNKIQITGMNRDNLPRYTLSGYQAILFSTGGDTLDLKELPDIMPGSGFNIAFPGKDDQADHYVIRGSDGYDIASGSLH